MDTARAGTRGSRGSGPGGGADTAAVLSAWQPG